MVSNKYIGKGKKTRMEASIKRIENEHGVKCIKSKFDPAINSKQGFIDEYRKMVKAGFNPKVNGFYNGQAHGFYNKIWSPGKKLVDNVVKIIVK